jgi:pyruvate/2-oxoglutarate dehydrogenase complex dihydrolipoamide acyltransferase (E2) component
MPDNPSYEIQYPSSRQLTMDLGKIGRDKHHVKALLEVDVTEARQKIKQSRQAGKKIAFTAWLIKVIADCVALHPPVNGLNRPRGWMIPFSMHPLCLAFGSLNEQPAVHQGVIQKREILHLTALIDHDVIDGMPSARFVDDLVKKMEAGWRL